MNVMEAIKERRSVRAYLPDEIHDNVLLKIIEAARLAPSAKNLQAWKFIVVKDAEIKHKLALAANQLFLAEAPVIIAAVATDCDHLMRCGVPAYAVDFGIAVEHMALAAAEEGLGTCWIGAFDQLKAKEILRVPDNCTVVTIMPFGKPNEPARPKLRKDVKEILCFDKFQ